MTKSSSTDRSGVSFSLAMHQKKEILTRNDEKPEALLECDSS